MCFWQKPKSRKSPCQLFFLNTLGSEIKFNKNRKPDGLPYRPIGKCFLLYKGKLVAQKGINQNNK